MSSEYARDLFQLQTELIDAKVDMAVSKAVDRVIDQIVDLKDQMNTRFAEVNKQFYEVNRHLSHLDTRISKLEHRVDTNEQTLHSVTTLLTELRSKVITYTFRGGWVIFTGIVLILTSQLTQLVHFFVK